MLAARDAPVALLWPAPAGCKVIPMEIGMAVDTFITPVQSPRHSKVGKVGKVQDREHLQKLVIT